MEKLKKILKNEYIFSILAKFLTIAIGLAQSVLLARYLGSELKGVHTYISSITSIGSIVITFGMHQAYPYLRKKYGKEAIYQDYFNLIYILYTIYMVIAVLIALFVFDSFELRAATILIPLLGYSNVMSYACLIETPNKRNTIWTVICFLEILFIGALMLCTERNLAWMLSILLFVDVLRSVVYTAALRVSIRFHKGLFSMWKELMKIGFFPMLALLMTTLNYKIDVLMMQYSSCVTAAQIGVYSIGIGVADKIVLIPDTLKGILASKLSKGAKDFEVARVSRLCFWASLAMCALFILVGKWGVRILYGLEYDGSYAVMAISAAGAVLIGYFKLIAQYNIINQKQVVNVIMLSISIVINVVLNLIFVPMYGINGAALSTCIAHLVCGAVFVVYFSRKTGIKAKEMILLQTEDMKMFKKTIGNKKVKSV